MKWTLIIAMCLYATLPARSFVRRRISIVGLFPTLDPDQRTRETLGLYPLVAAKMAVRHVNAMGFLSPRLLTMVEASTACSSIGDSLVATFQSLEDLDPGGTSDVVHIGGACDEPTASTAALTSGYFGEVQISYAAQNPVLSRVEQFPYFYRTVPTYSAYGESVYALMVHFDWLKVNVVHLESASFTRALEDLGELLAEFDKRTQIVASFGLTSLSPSLGNTGRIYIALVPVHLCAQMLCTAYRMGLTGPSYLWLLSGDFYPFWWDDRSVPCSRDEMLQAVESSLIFTHNLQIPSSEQETASGLTLDDFWTQFDQELNESGTTFEIDKAFRALTSYDAIWTLALGLNKSLPLLDDINSTEYSLEENLPILERSGSRVRPYTLTLHRALDETNFIGLSGKIKFLPDRHSRLDHQTYILQMQDGEMVPVAMHDDKDGTLNVSFFGNSFRWRNGGDPPRDRPALQFQGVDIWVAAIMLILTAVGIIFAVVLSIINCIYRKHKVIKASSPYINLMIISGCILAFVSVIFISIESIDLRHHIAPEAYPFLCNIRPWLLSTGFTFAFGALFAKTWRIYTIFKNPWMKKRPYKDYVLILAVFSVLAVDCVILILWMILDPLVLLEKIVDTDPVLFIQEVHVICAARSAVSLRFVLWIVAISAYKGLMLLFGVFVVKQTGKIKAKFFRDAKYTGIAIYGVVISCGIGVPIAFFAMFFYQEDITYVVSTGTIIFCCFLTLIMVFTPKLWLLRQYNDKIPTTVLIGLNPSFRIKRNMTVSLPLREKARAIQNQTNSLCNPSRLNQTVETLDETLEHIDVSGWEMAYESNESENVEMEEGTVVFGDVVYTAYVATCERESEGSLDSVNSERLELAVIENYNASSSA